MLETVFDKEWDRLQSAYGYASDVPRLLNDLCSLDGKVRSLARYKVSGDLIHQGTRYQATPHIIPFLIEIAECRDVQEREYIVLMLAQVALGCENEYLPFKFNVRAYCDKKTRQIEQRKDIISPNDALGPQIDLECYKGVEAQSAALLSLLSDSDENVRLAASYVLSWVPGMSCRISNILGKMLESTESECHRELAGNVLCYGLACWHSECQSRLDLIRPLIKHPICYVRVAAAISLSAFVHDEESLDVLTEGANCEELEDMFPRIYYNDGDLKWSAQQILDKV